jgi:eukaryotic-like serine/threonine-protein kinase
VDKIGKYEIREQLGRGGMGTVYRAYDPVMDREVALKVILDLALDVPEIKERFYREARTAGKLSHENITIVHDVGEDNGRPFIVMEYLTGADLRTLLERQEPMSAMQKLDIAVQICRGLAFSHANDVVHRDVKPANIRILNDGRVKIMDFGIARLGSSALTSTGAVMGTPYYMSPEQIQGKRVDRRADIFSCGVLLFELFTSQKPFRGEEPTSVMYKIVHEEPEGIDQLPRLYPEELSAILGRMLIKDPATRYQQLDDVVRELEIAREHLRIAEQKGVGADQQAATLLNAGPALPDQAHRSTLLHNPRLLWGIGTGILLLVAAIWYLSLPSVPMGAIALNVLPWAEVAKVERDSSGVVPLDKSYVTPCRIILPAGSYKVTCTHPQYKRPLTLRILIQKDSVLEVTQQWPGYDAAKMLSQF